jgi:PAS domain S-box-containing protein
MFGFGKKAKLIAETPRQLFDGEIEKKLKVAMEIADLVQWEYDFVADEFIFNDEYYALIGTSARDQGGYRMSSGLFMERFVYTEDRVKVGEEIQHVAASDDPEFTGSITHRMVRPDGGIRTIHSRYKAIRDDQGKIIRALGTTQDMTELKARQIELAETEERLRLAMDLAKIVEWEYDVASDTFTFNDEFYSLYGTTAEKEGGYQMRSTVYTERFVYPDDRQLVGIEIAKALQTANPHYSTQISHRIVRLDGEVRHVVVRFAVVKDEAGKTIRTYGANQDITNQLATDDSLHQQKSLMSDVLKTIPDFVFWKDRECVYQGSNLNFAVAAGLTSSEEIVGKNDFELAWKKEEAEKYRADDKAVMDSGTEKLNFVETRRQADGKETMVSTSKVPLFDKDGKVTGVLGIFRDITESRTQQIKAIEAERKFLSLFQNMKEGVAIHSVERDKRGAIVNYKILEMNPAFTLHTGLIQDTVIGKLATEAYGVGKPPYLEMYSQVIQTQKTDSFETYFEPLKRYFLVSVVPLSSELFATVFMDVTDEREKSRALEENEQRLDAIYNNAPDAIYLYDLKGTFVDGNRAAEQLTGYQKEELIGTSFLDQGLLAGSDLIKAAGNLAANVLGKSTGPTEYAIHKKDATIVTANIRNYPVAIGDKKLVLGIARDISNEIKSQIELRKFKLGIEQSADAVFTVDMENKITYVNPQFTRFYEYSKEEIIGQQVCILEATPSSDAEVKTLMDTLSRHESVLRQTQSRKKSGEIVIVENSISPIIDQNDQIIGTLVIDKDVSLRQKVEIELKKFKQGIERSDDVVFMTNKEGLFTYVNFAFTDLYGYEFDEIRAMTPRILKSGKQSGEFYVDFWNTLIKGSVVSAKLFNKTKNGMLVTMKITASPIIDDTKQVVGFLAIQRDVTKEEEKEAALAQRAEELGRLNKVMVGRELKMVELKRENELLRQRNA